MTLHQPVDYSAVLESCNRQPSLKPRLTCLLFTRIFFFSFSVRSLPLVNISLITPPLDLRDPSWTLQKIFRSRKLHICALSAFGTNYSSWRNPTPSRIPVFSHITLAVLCVYQCKSNKNSQENGGRTTWMRFPFQFILDQILNPYLLRKSSPAQRQPLR